MNKEEQHTEQAKKRKRGVKYPVFFVSMLIVAAASAFLTLFFVGGQETVTSTSSLLPGSTASSSLDAEDEQNLNAVFETLMDNYVEDVDEDKLLDGALTGMVEALGDPYSQYLSTEESENLDETINASFEGIGAEITQVNDQIAIVSPIKDSPAEKAGLLPNDIILSADGKSLSGLTTTEAVNIIRGEKGTAVQLEIQRGDQTFTVDVTRDTIPVETVTSELDKDDSTIGIIRVTTFSTPTYDEIVAAVTELREQGAKGFVFDFRSNPGGLLDQALKIANMFVDEGSVIVQTQEKDSEAQKMLADDSEYGDFKITEPAVMLVDEGSASASEIVAGALKENAGIPLVGTTTFGKGTVQSIYPISSDSELKLTVAKWLTPDGNWIHDKGIEPDYPVELPDYAYLTVIDTTAVYEEGEVSEAVKNVEQMLEAVGYPVEADGYFDADTTAQILQFQADNSLEETGELDTETVTALTEALRSVIAENDTQYEKAAEVLKEQMAE